MIHAWDTTHTILFNISEQKTISNICSREILLNYCSVDFFVNQAEYNLASTLFEVIKRFNFYFDLLAIKKLINQIYD